MFKFIPQPLRRLYYKIVQVPCKECGECEVGITYSVNKLQTKAEVLQWYLEMNEGQVAHTSDELERVRLMLIKEMMK